jgi:hypothetical protein
MIKIIAEGQLTFINISNIMAITDYSEESIKIIGIKDTIINFSNKEEKDTALSKFG